MRKISNTYVFKTVMSFTAKILVKKYFKLFFSPEINRLVYIFLLYKPLTFICRKLFSILIINSYSNQIVDN